MDANKPSKENRRINLAETGPCSSLVEKPFSTLTWLTTLGSIPESILELDESKINQAVTEMLQTEFGGPNLPSSSEPNLTSFPRRLPIFLELSARFAEQNRTELPLCDTLVKMSIYDRNSNTVKNVRVPAKEANYLMFSKKIVPEQISQRIVNIDLESDFRANNLNTQTNSYALSTNPHEMKHNFGSEQVAKWTTTWPPRVPVVEILTSPLQTSMPTQDACIQNVPFPEAQSSSMSVHVQEKENQTTISPFEVSQKDYKEWPNLGVNTTKVPQKKKWPPKAKGKTLRVGESSGPPENSNVSKKVKKTVFRPLV